MRSVDIVLAAERVGNRGFDARMQDCDTFVRAKRNLGSGLSLGRVGRGSNRNGTTYIMRGRPPAPSTPSPLDVVRGVISMYRSSCIVALIEGFLRRAYSVTIRATG